MSLRKKLYSRILQSIIFVFFSCILILSDTGCSLASDNSDLSRVALSHVFRFFEGTYGAIIVLSVFLTVPTSLMLREYSLAIMFFLISLGTGAIRSQISVMFC